MGDFLLDSGPDKSLSLADMVLKRFDVPHNRHLPHAQFQGGFSDAPLLKGRDRISQVPGFYRHYQRLAGSRSRNTALQIYIGSAQICEKMSVSSPHDVRA